MLRQLADFKRQGQLKIEPKRVVSVAEVLDPLDRRLIGDAFEQQIHQVYQCTEGFLAASCEQGTLHLNEDIVYVEKEYIDRGLGKFVPVITDFSRITQPIVRYRLNDILTEQTEACPCGSPFTAIEHIEGRCDDMYYFPSTSSDSSRLVAVFPDFISRCVVYASEHVSAYHAILHAPDRLEIQLDAAEEQQEDIQTAILVHLQALCQRLECRLPQVEFSKYQFTPGVTKLRRVERRFKHADPS
ncbi:F390 synthetase-related protein [Paenibacillus hexagrammi]|uniref:F390 synthetase-related protein n=1 Tax=Paenibacillus hexagrammi TaxID=2908839 RepID=UPI0028830DDC|nr:F390 synthetase-related protein [Paenibacillus sp. YPD9-1]